MKFCRYDTLQTNLKILSQTKQTFSICEEERRRRRSSKSLLSMWWWVRGWWDVKLNNHLYHPRGIDVALDARLMAIFTFFSHSMPLTPRAIIEICFFFWLIFNKYPGVNRSNWYSATCVIKLIVTRLWGKSDKKRAKSHHRYFFCYE